MQTIATLFTGIMTHLRVAVGNATGLRSADAHLAWRDAPRTALLTLLWNRIG
ncbi:MAG: hypothetical protein H7Y19_11925, partial [Luteimonas sp.]|nr:hypothetical protein [Luteimonas sp.]